MSPDGSRIAFVNAGTLFTMPLGGGTRTPVANGVALDQVSWAPDGSRIAVVAGEALCPAPGIATVSPAGGAATCLANGIGATDPSFSPDGTQIFVGSNGHAAFLDANGIGRREAPNVSSVDGNDWAPRAGSDDPRCASLSEHYARATDPRSQAIIRQYLTASGCPA